METDLEAAKAITRPAGSAGETKQTENQTETQTP